MQPDRVQRQGVQCDQPPDRCPVQHWLAVRQVAGIENKILQSTGHITREVARDRERTLTESRLAVMG